MHETTYCDIQTREVITIGKLVSQALSHNINKRTRKALGTREVWVTRDANGLRWIRTKPILIRD